MPRRPHLALALVVSLVGGVTLAGCGPALLVGGVLGLGALGEKSDRRDTPPAASATTPAGVVNDVIPLQYRLTDPEPGDRASIVVEFSQAGGPFRPCTQALVEGAEGTEALETAPGGADHVFQWSSAADLGFLDAIDVAVRITPRDASTGLGGSPSTTATFAVRNTFITSLAEPLVPAGVQATSLTVAPDGDVLVADPSGNRIVRVDRATGAATIVAGTGEGNDTGDGRPGPEATLKGPLGIAATTSGDVVIADTFNSRVRRVDGATGFITTFAGGGSERDDESVDIIATTAELDPRDVAVDRRGAVWVLETGRLHLVNGAGAQPLSVRPTSGVPDGPNAAVPVRPGFIRAVADGLAEATAVGVFDDGARRLIHILDFGVPNEPQVPRLVVYNDGPAPESFLVDGVTVVVGAGCIAEVASAANVDGSFISDLAVVDAQVLLFTTGRDNVVRCANFSASPVTIARTTIPPGQVEVVVGTGEAGVEGDGGPPLLGQLAGPIGVAWDPRGHVVIADANARLRVAASSAQDAAFGAAAVTRGTLGTVDVLLPGPAPTVVAPIALAALGPDLVVGDGAILDPRSNRLLSVRTSDGRVTTLAGTGTLGDLPDGLAQAARLGVALGVAADSLGEVAVYSDPVHHRVRAVNLASTPRALGATTLPPGQVTTIAGTGAAAPPPAPGDGGPPLLAPTSAPSALSLDPVRGLLWISDIDDRRVRAVNLGLLPTTVAGVTIAPGTIQSVVGTGALGSLADDGDGGLARDAKLSSAGAVLGPDGNLYLLDGLDEGPTAAPRLRVVNLSGAPILRGGVTIAPSAIDTVAGSGAPRAPDGSNLGDGGPALAATFREPSGLAIRDDLVALIADAQDHVVRAVVLGPTAVAVGGVTIAPAGVARVVGAGVPGFDGDPSTTGGLLDRPRALLSLQGGLLAIADAGNGAVRVAGLGSTPVGIGGRTVSPGDLVVLAGSRAGTTRCADPTGIALDGAQILFADFGPVSAAPAILAIDPQTRVVTRAVGTRERTAGDGSNLGDGGPAQLATLAEPFGIAVDAQRGLWIADTGNRRVRFVNRGAAARSPVPGLSVRPGEIDSVLDGTQGDGSLLGDDGLAVPSPLLDLVAPLDVDARAGAAWVVDVGGRPSRVLRVDLAAGRIDGIVSDVQVLTTPAPAAGGAGPGGGQLVGSATDLVAAGVQAEDLVRVLSGPVFLAGPNGPVPPPFDVRVVADPDPTSPNVVGVDGDIVPDGTPFTAQVVRDDAWTAVVGIAQDQAYVAGVDRRNGVGRIYRATRAGAAFTLVRVAGPDDPGATPDWNGDLRVATDMVFGDITDLARDGDALFVVDEGLDRIVVVNVGGGAVTVAGLTIFPGEARTVCGAGQGTSGYDGDGVPAANALLSGPHGVALDLGGVFLTDRENNRVRRFQR